MNSLYQVLLNIRASAFVRFLSRLQRFIVALSAIGLVSLLGLLIVLRYLFKVDLFGSEELIMLSAFWLYFFGAAKCSLENAHINADVVSEFIKNQKVLDGIHCFAKFVEMTVAIIFTGWSFNLVVLNFQKMPRTTSLRIPLAASQLPIFIGFTLMSFYAIMYFLISLCEISGAGKKGEGN